MVDKVSRISHAAVLTWLPTLTGARERGAGGGGAVGGNYRPTA